MATAAQIEANRRNAQKSTGPRTEQGKARSRQNALKHGMAAQMLLPEQQEPAFQGRVDQLNAALKPCDDWEWHSIEMLAVLSLRVERCWREEAAIRAMAARRAEHLWDDDRRLDAAELGRRLPSDPERVKLKLESTMRGCLWLAARWRDLTASGRRDDDEQARARLLLGLAEGAEGPADPLAEAETEIERLEGRAFGVLSELDDSERDLAECGMGPEVEKAVRRIRRYELACLRQMHWVRAQVGKVFRPVPPPPMPPMPPQYRPGPHWGDGPPSGANGPDPAPSGASAVAGPGANEADHLPVPGANEADPAPAAPPRPGVATLAGSLRSTILGRPAAPNRRSRRAARSHAA